MGDSCASVLDFFTKILPDYWKYPIGVGSTDVVFAFLWAFTTYAVFCVTLLMLIQNYKGITARQQTELITEQLKMQASQYEKLLDNIESTARLRHDWRHHLLSISGFAKNGSLAELQRYLDHLMPEYVGEEETALCLNHTADIILQYYAAMAKARSIKMTISANIPRALSIVDTDLCIILGNLIENAVEACMKQENGDKVIEIKAEMKATQLALLVKNTFQEKILFQDDRYYSTKHDSVGMGLASVKGIVEKNNGSMKVDYKENYFKVCALFHVE